MYTRVCVCVCVFVCTPITQEKFLLLTYIHTHIHTHTHTYIHTYMHTHTHTYTHTHTVPHHGHIRSRTTHARQSYIVHIYTHIYIHTYIQSLTTDTFDREQHTHDIMIVNFFAPWCHWCQKLEPVWEKSAATMQQKHPNDQRLVMAKVWLACVYNIYIYI